MDFVHDKLADGRAFRVLTVLDNWSRGSVLLEVAFRLTGNAVVAAISRVAMTQSLPRNFASMPRSTLQAPCNLVPTHKKYHPKPTS